MLTYLIYALAGIVAGLSAGLLGIGGGLLLVPIFYYILKVPMHIAVGTSLMVIVFTSISGSIKHFQLDNIDFKLALCVAIFSIIGSYYGAHLSEKLPADTLRRIFAVVLMLVSIKMFWK